jgi:hypothetical protein
MMAKQRVKATKKQKMVKLRPGEVVRLAIRDRGLGEFPWRFDLDFYDPKGKYEDSTAGFEGEKARTLIEFFQEVMECVQDRWGTESQWEEGQLEKKKTKAAKAGGR